MFTKCVLEMSSKDLATSYHNCLCMNENNNKQSHGVGTGNSTQQKRTCKIMQDCARILHARLAWHVHAICPFSCTILALSCKILHISCKKWCKKLQIILAASLAKSCTISCKICARSCKIVQESCKKRDISRARAMQVLHARFLHDLARILHDLASSFLLGRDKETRNESFHLKSTKPEKRPIQNSTKLCPYIGYG